MSVRVFVCGPVIPNRIGSLCARIDYLCQMLEEKGYEAVNPMKTPTANYRNMLKNDIVTMLQCDVIVMLEDWECSEYCKKLRRFAIECGIMLVSEDAI